jgi:hypothetical protein
MKRAARKPRAHKSQQPTPDQIRQHIVHLVDAHQCEWHNELLTTRLPDWSHLLCLHLRMVELTQIEAGMGELF